MNRYWEQLIRTMLASFFIVSLAGCMASTRTIDTNSEVHYNASYDFSDKKKIVDDLTASLLSSEIAYRSEKPILIVYTVANETSEHINTGGITDDIRLALIQSQKYRFINKKQRENIAEEVAYQTAGHVAVADQIKQGKQLGADYILSGTLRSIEKEQSRQWRLFEKKLVYYSLNLEMTDLVTGEIAWADKVELARESSKPIFRW
ncbi:MAG: penicillin-binding protein activator LpoB [Methyloligellaceae bacterium]